jgi:hypothetical protein
MQMKQGLVRYIVTGLLIITVGLLASNSWVVGSICASKCQMLGMENYIGCGIMNPKTSSSCLAKCQAAFKPIVNHLVDKTFFTLPVTSLFLVVLSFYSIAIISTGKVDYLLIKPFFRPPKLVSS